MAKPRLSLWAARIGGASLLTFGLIGISVTAAIAQPTLIYEVRPGDTLSGIAQEYQTTTASLAASNGIANPNLIRIGQALRISGGAPPALSLTMAPKLPAAPVATIHAPYFNQFDGSVWGPSNCGPAALATALGGIGIHAQPMDLRHLADRQMRNNNPANGTTWEALAYAAHQKGATTGGLYHGRYYRPWSVNDLKAELAAGHPVILLVRYRTLPDHATSHYWGDHYITALGFDTAGNLVYDDPAAPNGASKHLAPSLLASAWGRTSVGLVRTAMAIER